MQSLHPPRRRSVLRARADDPAASDTVEVHAHGGLPVGEHWRTGLFSSCQRRCREVFAPGPIEKPENAKSPAERGFSKCAEEDSNLHPVIPDQALNLARLPIPPSARGRWRV